MKLVQMAGFVTESILIVLVIADISVCWLTARKIHVFSTPRFRTAVIPKYLQVSWWQEILFGQRIGSSDKKRHLNVSLTVLANLVSAYLKITSYSSFSR